MSQEDVVSNIIINNSDLLLTMLLERMVLKTAVLKIFQKSFHEKGLLKVRISTFYERSATPIYDFLETYKMFKVTISTKLAY